MHQSTPGSTKNLELCTRLLVQVGRLGDWIADRTMRRRGSQIHMLTYVRPGEALRLGFQIHTLTYVRPGEALRLGFRGDDGEMGGWRIAWVFTWIADAIGVCISCGKGVK